MYNSIIKTYGANLNRDDKLVLDMNELVEKRLKEITAKMAITTEDEDGNVNQGFIEGLNPERVETLLIGSEGTDANGNKVEAGGGSNGNIIKASAPNFQELQAQAEATAQKTINDAKAEAEKIMTDAKIQAQNLKETAFAEARSQGYEDGQAQAMQELNVAKQDLERTKQKLTSEYEQKIQELEPNFIDTITAIYEHIFNVDLSSYRDILIYLISNTLQKVEGRSFLIHVSKEDFPYVNMQKKQLLAEAVSPGVNAEIVEDVSLTKNQCFVETDTGIFDCGLGTQLNELSNKLRLLSFER